MGIVTFDFEAHNSWNMAAACGDDFNSSTNPAPGTSPCIYIIHNKTENSTYVGYADNARHRWETRYEVFHIMGISRAYAQDILCAYCRPSMDIGSMYLQGQNNCEHLLIRAVVNGLLGKTTSTNTQLGKTLFINTAAKHIRVYLPSDPWGNLEGRKTIKIPSYGY